MDRIKEGYEDVISSEPTIPTGVLPTRLNIQAMPNSSMPNQLPYGPYLQTASIGSYQYQDPAALPAELKQMKQLYEDIRSFLVFEGPSISESSDPTVQLPLTQLRADSRKLQQEINVLELNPGIQSSLTQQNTADIQEALSFLQRKVRLFQTSGVISDGNEGFEDMKVVKPKTKATIVNLQTLQTKIYAAILTLSSSGTTNPVVQARIKRLQDMYSAVSDMINKLNKGIWKPEDVTVYKEDIEQILPNLVNPNSDLMNIFSQGSGNKLSPVQQQIANLVGEENVESVFKNIADKGMFRVSVDLGYNVNNTNTNDKTIYRKQVSFNDSQKQEKSQLSGMKMNTAFDSSAPSIEDRDEINPQQNANTNTNINKPGGLDWKKRTSSICEQVRLRGLDPLDFGCIAEGSSMSPAYSWRGHAKMVCGRLGTTMDPDLPRVCGCPPSNWKGWTLSYA